MSKKSKTRQFQDEIRFYADHHLEDLNSNDPVTRLEAAEGQKMKLSALGIKGDFEPVTPESIEEHFQDTMKRDKDLRKLLDLILEESRMHFHNFPLGFMIFKAMADLELDDESMTNEILLAYVAHNVYHQNYLDKMREIGVDVIEHYHTDIEDDEDEQNNDE